MANDNNDISDIVKKCKILLLDIEGTTTAISFVKDKLFPYAEENVKDFLTDQWESEDVKEVVIALRKLALEDKEKSVDGVVDIPGEDASKEDQIEGLVKSVKWQMSSDRKIGPLKQLQGLIWKQGYDKGDIKGHVYDDVSPALELWRSTEGQKVYIYSSGSVQAQKLLFGQSLAGDLLKFIDGHFDTAVGAKQEAASYAAIAEKIGCKAEDILFLTDIVKEAEAARSSGVNTALVSREGNAPLPSEASAAHPVLYSLAQLAITNKRKPDAQDEQPTKVPKTDVDADVKTASEAEVTSAAKVSSEAKEPSEDRASSELKITSEPEVNTEVKETSETKATSDVESSSEVGAPSIVDVTADAKVTPAAEIAPKTNAADEPEQMEVDEEDVTKKNALTESKTEKTTEKSKTIIEEVTDSNEIADTPVCDIEPIIEESSDKTEKPETEKMETESSETLNEEKKIVELKNDQKDAIVREETPPSTIITEIKDVTNDKEVTNEDAEMIQDNEPIIEEPSAAQDMEDLKIVGEVLEKECDEILSKVHDVTNLDNIPLKPLLNTISEESMETDNLDTNDIVEGILDSEMEMEMKQSAENDLKASEAAKEEIKNETQEAANNEPAKVTQENNSTDKVAEVKLTEDKVVESCPKKSNANDDKVAAVMNETSTDEGNTDTKMETVDSVTSETDNSKTKVEKTQVAESNEEEAKVGETKVKDTKVEETKAEPTKAEASKTEATKAEETKAEATKTVATKAEAPKAEAPKAEEPKAEEPKAEQTKVEERKEEIKVEEAKVEERKEQTKAEEAKVEEMIVEETKVGETKVINETKADEIKSDKLDTEVKKAEDDKAEKKSAEQSKMETTESPTTENDKVNDKAKPDSELKDTRETQANGKATNGDTKSLNLNGNANASKEDELNSRLSMENGKAVNGANGDSSEPVNQGKNENSSEVEVADIKVKSVAVDEPRNDPIEQPTEA